MQSISISRFIILLLGIFFAIYILIEAITSRTSVLGKLYLYIAIAAFLTGLLKPRVAIYVLIFCTAYIDFFKRLMVIAGNPTNLDVMYSLATPPLLCGGAMINLLLSAFVAKIKVTSSLIFTLVFACGLTMVSVITSTGEGIRSFGGIVNFVAYPYLLVLIPVFFQKTEDKVQLMKFIYIVFIGVAIYMMKHGLYGLADFEYAYLLTNLSQEVRILVEGENMRCFSTMNGAGIVSVMCALMFFWSFASVWKPSFFLAFIRWCLAAIFMVACYLTLSRTGWLCGGVSCVAYLLFRNWKTTVAAYSVGIGSVILLVTLSPLIKDMKLLEKAEMQMKYLLKGNDSRLEQATTIGSFNGRLNGWVNLMTKDHMLTPFGWKFDGQDFKDFDLIDLGDDMIFWSVVKYGYIPVSLGFLLFIIFLYKLHRFVCSLPFGSKERKISNICLATSIGIIVGGIGNAAQLNVFPVNIYFYLCLAFVYSIYLENKLASKNLVTEDGTQWGGNLLPEAQNNPLRA